MKEQKTNKTNKFNYIAATICSDAINAIKWFCLSLFVLHITFDVSVTQIPGLNIAMVICIYLFTAGVGIVLAPWLQKRY